jgi:NAD(P)-dependent dehydrogenase (short-subunit alcohol dehydrogenase family)
MSGVRERRVLVVGASSGIGRGIAEVLSAEGAHVAVAARRTERLEELAEGCTGDVVVFTCDVTDPEACTRVVDEATAAFGGLDALVYASGTTEFVEVSKARYEDWRRTLDTNLVGLALVAGAAVPHLAASCGHVVYLSSNSARYNSPWRGIGLYIASKLGAESLMRSFRLEVPEVAFTTLVVGPTISEFGSEGDVERFAGEWYEREHISADLLMPEDHAAAVVALLSADPRTLHSEIVLEPRRLTPRESVSPPG